MRPGIISTPLAGSGIDELEIKEGEESVRISRHSKTPKPATPKPAAKPAAAKPVAAKPVAVPKPAAKPAAAPKPSVKPAPKKSE